MLDILCPSSWRTAACIRQVPSNSFSEHSSRPRLNSPPPCRALPSCPGHCCPRKSNKGAHQGRKQCSLQSNSPPPCRALPSCPGHCCPTAGCACGSGSHYGSGGGRAVATRIVCSSSQMERPCKFSEGHPSRVWHAIRRNFHHVYTGSRYDTSGTTKNSRLLEQEDRPVA